MPLYYDDDQTMLAETANQFMAEEGSIKNQLRHWRDRNCNNAHSYVTRHIQQELQWYEKDACEFPDPEIFDEVRPGETYACYMARRREELRHEAGVHAAATCLQVHRQPRPNSSRLPRIAAI